MIYNKLCSCNILSQFLCHWCHRLSTRAALSPWWWIFQCLWKFWCIRLNVAYCICPQVLCTGTPICSGTCGFIFLCFLLTIMLWKKLESVQEIQSITIWIKQVKWQRWRLENTEKRENNIAVGRHRILSPHTSVCVQSAYKLWILSGQSSKPNAHILNHVTAVKKPNPVSFEVLTQCRQEDGAFPLAVLG